MPPKSKRAGAGKRKRSHGDHVTSRQLCVMMVELFPDVQELGTKIREKLLNEREDGEPCVPGFINNDMIALALLRGAIKFVEQDGVFRVKTMNYDKINEGSIDCPYDTPKSLLQALGCSQSPQLPRKPEASGEESDEEEEENDETDEEDKLLCTQLKK